MIEVVGEVLYLIIGRIILGYIGASIRYFYYSIFLGKRKFSDLLSDKEEFAKGAMNKEGFKSRVVGIVTLVVFSILIAVITN